MISCVTMEIMICEQSEAVIVERKAPRNLELEMKSGHSQALVFVLATISSTSHSISTPKRLLVL